MSTDQIGELAARHGLVLHEVTARGSTLTTACGKAADSTDDVPGGTPVPGPTPPADPGTGGNRRT